MSLPTTILVSVDRLYSRGEVVADGIVHGVAILAGLVGFGVLFSRIVDHGSAANELAAWIYAFGFFLMFGCSCAYNMTPPSPLKLLLNRFDRAAIFVMIAGTYTGLLAPFADQLWAGALLVVVWTGALLGSFAKLLLPDRWEHVSLALYVILGWVVIFAIEPLIMSLPVVTLTLVVIGGALYSTGIIFYRWHSLKFQNAIWHCFVLGAAGCHYAGVAYVMAGTV